jgi:hypothetical protein
LLSKKGDHDVGNVYMANSVTMKKLVQLEILKATSKCFASNREVMHVSAFLTRPLLHLRLKEAGVRQMTFTWVGI